MSMWGSEVVQNAYANYNRKKKDKAGWLDPLLTAGGAVAGSLLMPGVGTMAGASLGARMGHAAGSVGHSLANGQVDPMQIGQAALTIGQGYQAGQGNTPQTSISPQGGGTQPMLPDPYPQDNAQILQTFMQNPQHPMFQQWGQRPNPQHFYAGGPVMNPNLDPRMLQMLLQGQQGQGVPSGPTQTPQGDPGASSDVLGAIPGQVRSVIGNGPTEPTPNPLQTASHPGWEATAAVLAKLLESLPKPANPKNTKAIGAWAPALGVLAGAPGDIAAARRTAANGPIAAGNEARRAKYESDKKAYDSQYGQLANTLAGNATKPFAGSDGKPRVPVMLSDWEYMKRHNAIPKAISDEVNANGGTLSDEGFRSFQSAVDNLRQSENSARIANAQAAATDTKAQQAAQGADYDEQLAQGLADYSQDPSLLNPRASNYAKVASRAQQILRENGSPYTLAQLRLMSKEASGFLTVQNQQRFTALRQAAVTVRKHLEQFKEFYRKYSRIKPPIQVRYLGKSQFDLALEGWLGVPAQRAAAELAQTADPVSREAALVFTSGFAPLEHDMESARNNLEVASMSRSAGEGSIKALERLLEARIQTAMNATPFASGKDNPYLKAFNPKLAWNDAASEQPTQVPLTTAPAATGAPPQGYVPPGLKPVKEGR